MRRDRIKQRITHSFKHHTAPATNPYPPTTRYSALLNSSDRLLFAHPDPATRAPSPSLPSSMETASTTPSHRRSSSHIPPPKRSSSAPTPQNTAAVLLQCTQFPALSADGEMSAWECGVCVLSA
ncbi:hypothetical protein SNOG_07959 [Parastagonospora nodorum SN15]|uniref:Uncharacterized protein n=1 Tax=Phaeosphaeria nodorum (strain SN15 / ATCC MYA-4574 / FGSC 10173) TaxID=321614 RepID=Q0UJV5_PHANO|nr:hypothetical protein SNOG_07959 [Parastagonospora nodorum SN15]EAT84235.1 hypothetical protein SNOG_07959 [Parastagonospora nodorum SN15]